jgi:flagellin-like hook-associated protein FlgL
MLNILRNRLYVYDGILDNLNDTIACVNLSEESLQLQNNIAMELNNALANISNPHTSDAMLANLRKSAGSLILEMYNCVRHSRYNSQRCLADDDEDHSQTTSYALPGLSDDMGGERDDFVFTPPKTGITQLPRKELKVKDAAGETIKNEAGNEFDFKLSNLQADMENDQLDATEIRGRVEQYITVTTECIKDVNQDLEVQRCNKARLEFRKRHVEHLKSGTKRNYESKSRMQQGF